MSHQSHPILSKRRRTAFTHAFRIAIAVGIFAEIWLLAQLPETARALTNATTRQSENFTEIYFVDPPRLPRTVTAGQPQSFIYRIQNHQSTKATYTASVTVIQNGVASVVQNNVVTISSNGNVDIAARFRITQPNTAFQVIVSIPAADQTIHFRGRS